MNQALKAITSSMRVVIQKASEPVKKDPTDASEPGFVEMKRMSLPRSRTSLPRELWTSCPPAVPPPVSAPLPTRIGIAWLCSVTYLREARSK